MVVAERMLFEESVIVEIGFRFDDNALHPAHRLDSILSNSCFAREHDARGRIINGIGDVGNLGARGPWIIDHRFQHLRRRNHRLTCLQTLSNHHFLQLGNKGEIHFDAEIAAGHHNTVRDLDNAIEVFNPLRAFNFCNDENI